MALDLLAIYRQWSKNMSRALLLLLLFVQFLLSASAEETVPGASDAKPHLPDPLTLEYLLELDIKDHPDLQRASAAIELQNANKELALSDYETIAGVLLQAVRASIETTIPVSVLN